MQKKMTMAIMAIFLLVSTGCFTHQHTLESGYLMRDEEIYHQWYLLWGMVPVGEDQDSGRLSKTPQYRVITKFTWMDAIMNLTIPGLLGFGATRRTVVVQK